MSFTINVLDDNLIEGPESAVFAIASASTGLSIGAPNSFTFTIADNDGWGISNRGDILLRNSASGVTAMWLMDGATRRSAHTLPTTADARWKIAAVGDFDGDGGPDLLWRHHGDGRTMNRILLRLLGRLPIVLLQLTHNPMRFAAALIGVAFANVLVFVQLGIMNSMATAAAARTSSSVSAGLRAAADDAA